MRTNTPFARPAIIATLGAALALAACDQAADTETDAMEEADAMISDNADAPIMGEEIEEAVPGIEEAAPEGDTPNTADLGEEENIEVAEEGDLYEEGASEE